MTHKHLTIKLPQGDTAADRHVRSIAKAAKALCDIYLGDRGGDAQYTLHCISQFVQGASDAIHQDSLDRASQRDATRYGDPT